MYNIKKVISILLVIAFLFSTGCSLKIVKLEQPPQDTAEPSPKPTPETTAPSGSFDSSDYDRGLVDFNDMEYTQPDFDAVAAHISAIEAMLTGGYDGQAILEEYDKLEDEFLDFYSQYSLLQVYSSQNVNDTKTSDEVEALSEKYAELGVLGTKLEIKIYNSEFKDTVFWDWTEREFHNLLIAEKLYDDEYVRLEKRLTELTNDYWDVMNNTTVEVNGEAYTLDELQAADALDQEEYSAYLETWYKTANEAVGELYLEFININKRIAEKAGYENYNDYAYDFVYERDYTPSDVRAFCQIVKDNVCSVMFNVYGSFSYEEYMGLSMAMQGDNQVDMRRSYIEAYAASVSPEMNEAYHYLDDYNLSVFTTGSDSQAGAYTTFFPHYDTPFIYINENGGYSDVLTFIHEFGHFYGFYVGGCDAMQYQSTDVSEIMSQADELLFLPSFKDFYGESAYMGIAKYQMFNYLLVMAQGCLYDEFQQYVYTHDIKTVEELNKAFSDISASYQLGSGFYGMNADYLWIDVMHNFECPLYYISYAASIIPALEIFELSTTDRDKAIEVYNDIVHSDPKSRFGQVLHDSGLSSPFEEQTVLNIINNIMEFTGVGENAGNK
jgi:M3 family oligoendopeptidase